MGNEINSTFYIDAGPGFKTADEILKKVSSIDASLNKLGKSTFGVNLAGQFDKLSGKLDSITASLSNFGKNVDSLSGKLNKPLGGDNFFSHVNQGLDLSTKKLQTFEDKLEKLKRGPRVGTGNDFGNSLSGRLGLDLSGSAAGFLGGIAGGAFLSGATQAKSLLSDLVGEVKDLGVQSVRLAGDFEETTNALAVFTGGITSAKKELSAIDNIALATPGLTLETAEKGYQRLRALNVQAGLAQDLIKGLATQRILSGADSGAIDRVTTNLLQLSSGAGTAADVRQTIQNLPSLRPVFQSAFGTTEFGKINKIAKDNPDQFLQKFATELGKTQTAQLGLNIAIEKGQDALIQAGRTFGEPLLAPLTRDVQDLTKYLNENQQTFRNWGQSTADTIQAVSDIARGAAKIDQSTGYSKYLTEGARLGLGTATGGFSESAIATLTGLEGVGRAARENEKKVIAGLGTGTGILGGGGIERLTAEINKVPSLADKIDAKKAEKEVESLRRTVGELGVGSVNFKIAEAGQSLELSKAIATRDAKGNTLQLIKQTADLEIRSLREQISLSNQLADAKRGALSKEDFNAGKGFLISQENQANVSKLENQISVTRINQQTQTAEALKNLKSELGDTLSSLASVNNPLIKTMYDLESAVERVQDKFGKWGDFAVKKITEIEKANLTKALGLGKFESSLKALGFDQEARRLQAAPERSFEPFQKDVEGVRQSVDFTSGLFELNRKIAESNFFSNQFNPNNPKSFNQSRFSFGELEKLGDAGVQLKDSIDQIKNLSDLSLQGTGIYGKGFIADKILEVIPKREDLIKQLNSPYAGNRENAQFLLSQQTAAFQAQREGLIQKNRDFLEDRRTFEFGKQFARERLDLVQKSFEKGELTKEQFALQRSSIFQSLGNDLDPMLRRGAIAADLDSRNIQNERIGELVGQVKTLTKLVDTLVGTATGEGFQIHKDSQTASTVVVKVDDDRTTKTRLNKAPGPLDTSGLYGAQIIQD